jgi:hypothetical protein
MKTSRPLAMREILVFVAIVASAVTWHVRQQAIAPSAANAVPSDAQYGRMCEPSTSNQKDEEARTLPADCKTRAGAHPVHATALWV